MNPKLSRLIALATVSVMIALAIGFVLSYRPVRGIELSPNSLTPDTIPIEGDTVTLPVVRTNPNAFPVRLGKVIASGGCSKISLRAGEELKEGQQLLAGGSLDLEITVNTAGQVSPRQVGVEVPAAKMDGTAIPAAEARIHVPVKGGPRVEPAALILKDIQLGKETSGEVVIVDGQDSAVLFQEVKFSDPHRFSGKLIPVEMLDGETTSLMKRRYRLVVTYHSDQPTGMNSSFVELIPADSRFAPIQVPIYAKSSANATGFVPEKLVLSRRAGDKTMKRKVLLKVEENSDSEVKLVSSPHFVAVQIGKHALGTQEIELTIDMEALASSSEESRVVLAVGKKCVEHTLVVKGL